jgi:hypothetical protein
VLTISGISITSATGAAGDFLETSNCMPGGVGSWQPGQSCAISVQFRPTVAGTRVAQLNIVHNAAGSPLVITLTGTGFLPIIRPPIGPFRGVLLPEKKVP